MDFDIQDTGFIVFVRALQVGINDSEPVKFLRGHIEGGLKKSRKNVGAPFIGENELEHEIVQGGKDSIHRNLRLYKGATPRSALVNIVESSPFLTFFRFI
jgi:hypothetical protein